VSAGKVKLAWERGTYNNTELCRWLERAICGGREIYRFSRVKTAVAKYPL
jgi:hypothetical protein